MNIVIRPTELPEANLLPDIERSAGQSFLSIPDLAWLVNHDVMSPETHREFILAETSWVAATEDNVLVGFLSAECFGDELHLWELSVHAEHQGQGIGKKLIQCAMDYARRNILKALTLTTFREVAWNEPFYQRLGFVTLTAGAIGPRLSAELKSEQAHGLPIEQRCAMRCLIAQ
ncbi:MAG: GNAT family N-acetyltransferase [Pseudomonadota bacterium]